MQSSDSAKYRAAGFGRGARRGVRPAVIVVDLTRGFTEPTFPTGADGSAVIEAANEILHAAHACGHPVILTKIAYSHPDEARAWRAKAPVLESLTAGSPATDLDPRLLRTDTDIELVKHGASAFFDTPLRSTLHSLGADTLVVCGATTSGCVRATAVDGVQCGYGVLVPQEAALDRADEPHRAALFDLEQKYADVVDTATIVDYLQACAAPDPRGHG